MERIKHAIERARRERGGDMLLAASLNSDALTQRLPPTFADITQIIYTRTRQVVLDPVRLKRERIVLGTEPSAFADAYRVLRTQVLHRMREHGLSTLAITSVGPGEGKTLTAVNLAIALAMELDKTVLLVDADLRRPSLRRKLDLPAGAGLSDHLLQSVPIDQILIHPGIARLVVLPGGAPLTNSSEILASRAMAMLMQELKNRYPNRYVIFDMPPLMNADDVLAFAPMVDCSLLVVEDGKTREDNLQRATELLGSSKVLGAVLNKVNPADATVSAYGSY